MIKAVIFDMDGVLINSQETHYKADIMALSECGFNVDLSFVMKGAGTSTLERFSKWKNELGYEKDAKEVSIRREEMMKELLINDGVDGVKGAKELLMDIKKNNIKTAVASSSAYDLIYTVIDALGERELFDKILSGEDVENGKPAPDVFLKAAELLGVEPSECIVIEDSTNGVKAGVAAGMRVLGYINPTSGEQDLSKASCITDDFTKFNFEKLLLI